MKLLIQEIKSCKICQDYLPFEPKPILSAHRNSKIVIIGQAPGMKVQLSGIPWDDKSGDKLREWLGVTKDTFYDEQQVAIIPMGFCYPGKSNTGDLPPRKECAPQWHKQVLNELKDVKLILLIGKYAQDYYLSDQLTLTERVRSFHKYMPDYFVLPHPSPRNNIWMAKNEWFKHDVLPMLKYHTQAILTKKK